MRTALVAGAIAAAMVLPRAATAVPIPSGCVAFAVVGPSTCVYVAGGEGLFIAPAMTFWVRIERGADIVWEIQRSVFTGAVEPTGLIPSRAGDRVRISVAGIAVSPPYPFPNIDLPNGMAVIRDAI